MTFGNKSAIKFLQDYITFSYTILNKIISIFHDYNKYTFTFGIVLFASLQYYYYELREGFHKNFKLFSWNFPWAAGGEGVPPIRHNN